MLLIKSSNMDIWEKLYNSAKALYHPQYISPFIYTNHVVCALEAENGDIYTGFCIRSCSGVGNLCAERVAALNMFVNSGQTKIKRIATFRDVPPTGNLSIPCGACREFLMQLNIENKDTEIITEYEGRKTIILEELTPMWWGYDKLNEKNKS
mgnify:CR=1 FL=1